MKLEVTTETKAKPAGVVIYSKSGLGKSTFLIDAVNDAKNGILIQLGEDSLGDLRDKKTGELVKVPHLPNVIGAEVEGATKSDGWNDFKQLLAELIKNDNKFTAIAFDNFDNIVKNNLRDYTIDKFYKNADGSVNTVKAMAYGGDWLSFAYKELARVIKGFEMLQNKGVSIFISCHGTPMNVKDPNVEESYSQWHFDIPSKKDANLKSLLADWSSATLFGTVDIIVNSETHKAKGSRRVLMSQTSASYEAKCRYNIPDKIDFSYAKFKEHIIEASKPKETKTDGK